MNGDAPAEQPRFGWEDWTWDASLFEGSARYYRKGRIPYAEGLAASLATELDLDGHTVEYEEIDYRDGYVDRHYNYTDGKTLVFAPLAEGVPPAVTQDAFAKVLATVL